jgi:26S proteasome regulatory subunit N1
LEERKTTAAAHIDSAKQNLAATYVNAFVNAGFGKDLLLSSGD